MLRFMLVVALWLLTGCSAEPGPGPAPAGAGAGGGGIVGGGTAGGGGGGGMIGAAPGDAAAFPVDRPPGERVTDVACPVDFAAALEAEIAAVDDRLARDALAFQHRDLERVGGASYTARLNAVSRLQALAQRLERQGDLPPDQAARLADLAPCYLE